jgi:hypothetical protein
MRSVIALRADDVTELQVFLKSKQDSPKSKQDSPKSKQVSFKLKRLDDTQLEGLMGKPDPQIMNQIHDSVAVFRVQGDPHDVASELRRRTGIDVSPIHALGSLSHIQGMSGTDPQRTTVKTEPVIAASSPGRVVAAIDTGVTKSLPVWLDSGLEYDAADIETLSGKNKASHGTFVAGLIRRVAPEHTISMTRARRWNVKELDPKLDASHYDADDPSTELHVLEAMIRLVNRLGGRDRCDVAALNLSLGGSCDEHDPGFVTLRIALDLWRNSFPKVPIFAAGGNTPDTSEVYPGAFEFVRSVAAAKDGGRQVVWDRTASRSGPLTAPDRPWITDVAPGSDLVSPSGRTRTEWVKWSGSSFATAVATASYVSNRPMEASDGLIWWADRQTKAADIPGLVL